MMPHLSPRAPFDNSLCVLHSPVSPQPRPHAGRSRGTACTLAARLAVACALLLSNATAHAAVRQLSIDHVRVMGPGRHEVVVRAQDETGAPVEHLESELSLTLDGRGVGELSTTFSGGGQRILAMVIDAPLLRGETAALVDQVLRAVAGGLADNDRVFVVLAGDKPVSREWSAADLTRSGDVLGSIAAAGGPRLFDAMKLAAGKAAGARREGLGAMLVVTRASDQGSHATAADVERVVLNGGVTSLALVLVPGGSAGSQSELESLVQASGGASWSAAAGTAVPATLVPGVRALLARYVMMFRDTQWHRDGASHRLVARVGDGGTEVVAERRYIANEVATSTFGPTLLIILLVVVLVAGAGLFLWSRRRRQVCLLVVRGGEEDRQWFEVFELPLSIGCARENDIVLVDDSISRRHCALEREGRSIVVVDLGSEYGTFINGTRVSRHVLAEDDVLRLGTEIDLVYEGR